MHSMLKWHPIADDGSVSWATTKSPVCVQAAGSAGSTVDPRLFFFSRDIRASKCAVLFVCVCMCLVVGRPHWHYQYSGVQAWGKDAAAVRRARP